MSGGLILGKKIPRGFFSSQKSTAHHLSKLGSFVQMYPMGSTGHGLQPRTGDAAMQF
jgi:hypothetical protein